MFTSYESGKELHTVDGTNSVQLRVDSIDVQFFAIPSSYTEEKLFFMSYLGNRSRRNYDYVIEVESNISQRLGTIHEIKGTSTFVLALEEGKYKILDFDLNELLTYDISSGSSIVADNCILEETA